MRKVVIVGSNQLTRHLIDWDQDADYWLFNEAAGHDWAKTVTGVFQMHSPAIWRNGANVNDPGHYQWLTQPHNYPIYMMDKNEDVPASVQYPLDDICQALLPNIARKSGEVVKHFTSSASYAIALAIYYQYDIIELVGIEMVSGTEYAHQRDGVTFWLGVAVGRGINVVLQDQSLLMNTHLYGYEGEIVIHRQRFEIVANGIEPKLEQIKTQTFEARGKVNLLLKQLAEEENSAKAQKLFRELVAAMNEKSDLDYKYGALAGALAQNQSYIREVDALIQAAGGERTLQTMAAAK